MSEEIKFVAWNIEMMSQQRIASHDQIWESVKQQRHHCFVHSHRLLLSLCLTASQQCIDRLVTRPLSFMDLHMPLTTQR